MLRKHGGTTFVFAGGSSLGMAARLASGSSSSMKNCSRTIFLNCASVRREPASLRASPPQCLEAALIDHSPRHADIEQAANDAFPETAAADLRFELGDARLQTLAVLRRHLRLRRDFGIRRDADGGLHRGRSIDAEEERLTECFLRVAPFIEHVDDVLRDGLLELEERIVLCRRLALLANLVSRSRDAPSWRAVSPPKASYETRSGCRLAHPFRHLGRNARTDPRLHEIPVVREIDFGYTRGGRKPPFIFGRVAAHGPDIVQRAPFASHDPLSARKIGMGRVGGFGFERCLVKPGRQHVDQVDVAREFAVLLLGDAAGDKDAEMPDRLVNGVDDGLSVSADLVDVAVEIENPAERLLRRRDVVAL